MSNNDCPYGAKSCPKMIEVDSRVNEFKREMDRMRSTQMEMQRILYLIVGIVTVSLGVNLGGIL